MQGLLRNIVALFFIICSPVLYGVDQCCHNQKQEYNLNDSEASNTKQGPREIEATALRDPLFTIDTVAIIVDGPERRHVICKSELEQMGIDGVRPEADKVIIEELIYQDALKLKIPIDDYADRYINSIKKEHNISDKDVERIFESAGLTVQEGRVRLQKMGANSTMIDLKVKARIFVPQSDIENYYHNNPEYKDAKYQIEVAFVPFFSHNPDKQNEQYSYLLHQMDEGSLDVMWGQPFWLKHGDIADSMQFITVMDKGDTSKPQRVVGGFEIYRLKDKRDRKLVPLDKRFRVIIDTLREPKFKELFDKYIEELANSSNASIIIVDKTIHSRFA